MATLLDIGDQKDMDFKSSIFNIGEWRKKAPASSFEDTGQGKDQLVFQLERKLDLAAKEMGIANAREHLARWISSSSILAVIFQGAELVCERLKHVNMHVVANDKNANAMQLFSEVPATSASVFSLSVSDLKLLRDCSMRRDPLSWRAFFSGELLMLGHDVESVGLTKEFIALIQERFERDVIADLRELIAYDVWTTQFPGSKTQKEKVELPENEFSSIAEKALRFRRVTKPLRKKMIPEVRKALSSSCPKLKTLSC
jgi:hypothetical protein